MGTGFWQYRIRCLLGCNCGYFCLVSIAQCKPFGHDRELRGSAAAEPGTVAWVSAFGLAAQPTDMCCSDLAFVCYRLGHAGAAEGPTAIDLLRFPKRNERSSALGSIAMAPAVQIAVHEISDEGLVCLVPLVHSEHPEIREGVAALLAERYLQETEVATEFNTSESNVLETRPVRAWTQFQGSRSLLEKRLQGIEPQLRPFLLSTSKRQQAIARFRVWTNRWY